MIDIREKQYCPSLEEISEYVRNPVFWEFCCEIKNRCQCIEKIEYSSCSMEPGWNVKFKKRSKSLCTIYPREAYFTVMVVIGKKEKERTENLLQGCSAQLQQIYHQTKEGKGQRWLMIDVEDQGDLYNDILKLIDIRRGISK